MNLGEFHTLISGICARGDTLDSIIPTHVRLAAKFIEANHSFVQMRKKHTLAITAASRDVTPPDVAIKRILDFSYLLDDGTLRHLIQLDSPKLVSIIEEDYPQTFWIEDGNYRLGEIPDDDYEPELLIYEYTEWPTANTSTNYLLEEYEGILISQTIMHMGPAVRNKEMIQEYASLWKMQWQAALLQDYEMAQSIRNEKMYGQ